MIAKGLCSKHYQRLWSHGDPSFVTTRTRMACEVAGCDRVTAARGRCDMHYRQVTRQLAPRAPRKYRTHETWPHPSFAACICIRLTRGQVAVVDERHAAFVCAPGDPPWYAFLNPGTGTFYAARTDRKSGQVTYLHRLIAFLEGWDPLLHVDHIHHDTLDDRASQMRVATPTQNQRNKRRQRNNTSGVTGVILVRGRWQARISVANRSVHVGSFGSKEAAVEARRAAERDIFGEFAFGANVHFASGQRAT